MIHATSEGARAAARLSAVTVLPLMVASLALGCRLATEAEVAASPSGERVPAADVTQNFAVFRPTSPAAVGDGDFSTDIRASVVAGGTPTPATTRLVSDDLAGVPAYGEVSYVRVSVAAGLLPGAPFGNYTAARIVWTLGATENSEAVTMFPFVSIGAPTIGGDNFATEPFIRSTGPLTERPGGGAWTWADVLALVHVGVEVDHTIGAFLVGGVVLGDAWVDVYGKSGTAPAVIQLRQVVGNVRRVQSVATE